MRLPTKREARSAADRPTGRASGAWLGVALAVGHLAACSARPPVRTTPGPGPRGGEARPADDANDADGADRAKKELSAIGQLESITELWNAQNQAQDRLGQALVRLEAPTRYRVVTEPRARPDVESPEPAKGMPSRAPLARWSRRDEAPGLCRDACRHVVAICYASRRICVIADRLREWSAREACRRASGRCDEAHRAVRARCPRCPGS